MGFHALSYPQQSGLSTRKCSNVYSACFQACSWNLFATRYNNQLLNFFSPFTDPLAAGMDALSLDWADRDLDAFPPFPLIPKVLQRLERFQCQLTLIAPLRWNRSWISPLSPGVSQSRGSFPCVRTCFSSFTRRLDTRIY